MVHLCASKPYAKQDFEQMFGWLSSSYLLTTVDRYFATTQHRFKVVLNIFPSTAAYFNSSQCHENHGNLKTWRRSSGWWTLRFSTGIKKVPGGRVTKMFDCSVETTNIFVSLFSPYFANVNRRTGYLKMLHSWSVAGLQQIVNLPTES